MEYIEIVKEQLNAHKNNRSYALVTIIGTDGATTRKNGRMLVYGTGERLGTIGGGAIEALAVRDAVKAALSGESGLCSYDLNTEASAAGLACGGAMQVWIDAVPARPVLVMCGGGHVGMAVMPLARSVGFEVILVDKRPKVELGSAIEMADRFFRAEDMEKGLLELELPAGAYYVIAGPNHDADGAALAGALKKDGAYVGMIGGPPKINAIFAKLKAKGFSEGELAAVHTPIGLDISNERPEEIAVAILAEILMVKNGKGVLPGFRKEDMLMTLMEKVLEEARPHMEGRGLKVADGVIGLNFVGVTLNNGRSHFIYLMRESLPSGDMIFGYGEKMIGMDAWEVAKWAQDGAEDLQRSLGVAALNAASPFYFDPRYRQNEDFYNHVNEETVMGVIGHMPPLVERFSHKVKHYYSFDRAIDLKGTVEGAEVYPMEREAELLPLCDTVTITGTSMINHTTEEILSMCRNARHVILSGFSVPFYPEAYRGSGLTALGTLYFTEDSTALMRPLSLAAGRLRVREYTQSVFCRLSD